MPAEKLSQEVSPDAEPTEADILRSFIAQALPFLKEAWEACFRDQKEKLLSAEERGMGDLIRRFAAIADAEPCLPPGVVTQAEASAQREKAIEWAHKMLGAPNKLKEPLRQYIMAGETCADGIERAHATVESQKEEIAGLLEALEERLCPPKS